MIKPSLSRAAFGTCPILGLLVATAMPATACDQWLAPAQMEVIQTNGPRVGFSVIQEGTNIHGFAKYLTTQRTIIGNYRGTIVGDVFYARVLWTYSGVSAIGQYRGKIKPRGGVSDPKGYIFEGTTFDEYRQPPDVQYWNAYHFTCQPVASPAPAPPPVKITQAPAGDSATAVLSRARVDAAKSVFADSVAAQATTETSAAGDVARLYRVAPPAAAPVPVPVDTAGLADRGAALAGRIVLAEALRGREPDESAQRGFDIGMGAAEGQTLPGPGKQRIHDSLPQSEQEGFDNAVAFSLDWNRNIELARDGAAIADGSPDVAQARESDPDPMYWLGFDIATGIFAGNAPGDTATGPDSTGIRNALGARTQRGFDASAIFHQGR